MLFALHTSSNLATCVSGSAPGRPRKKGTCTTLLIRGFGFGFAIGKGGGTGGGVGGGGGGGVRKI